MQFDKSEPADKHRNRKIVWRKMPCDLRLDGKDHSGFTLVEILLAVFIFATVISIIYTSYTRTFRIIDETEYQADVYSMARIALERMYEDLESVYAPQPQSPESSEESDQGTEFVGEVAEIDGRRADSLRFTSRAHLVFSEVDQASGTAEIGYYVAESDDEEDLALYRKDIPNVGGPRDQETRGLVLCERLQSVSFTYYDAEGEVYDNWDSTSEEFEGKVPRMVSILFEFANKSDPEAPFKFLTTVALPMGVEKESA
jgi:prepilin-type N-terminal cleavage/methylation domain-containing protein